MPNLFASLRSSADALGVFERALDVTQNNVANASTPGYAKQRLSLTPAPFDPNQGLAGGVQAGQLQSARDEFAEAAVRRQASQFGQYDQMASSLQPLELAFDVSGQAGIPGALNELFTSFSNWSVNPNDATSQQTVLSAAEDVARSFQQTAASLGWAAADTESQIRSVTDQINQLAGQVQQYNLHHNDSSAGDASLGANLHSTLEQLSELADISAITQADGSITVLMDGRTPLVVGAHQYKISASLATVPAGAGGPPSALIIDGSGADITATVSGGRLGGLLEAHNHLLASLRGDGTQPGDLNRLAQALADRVNAIITDNGNQPGQALFSYDATADPSQIAASLQVNSALQPGSLVAGSSATGVSNGIALDLAGLARSHNPADQIDGLGYVQYYGGLAARVGAGVADAKTNQGIQQQLLTQARNLRDQHSAVSLDEEAVSMLQWQRSYEALSKVVTALDELTQTIVNMIS